jgi:CBS-domain-containing membrane protein
MTRVEDIMSKEVFRCYGDDSLSTAAQLMWEHDCGCIPVVDGLLHVVGIITDRDVCMAAYTQGRGLSEIPVSSVCTREVRTCRKDEPLTLAEEAMAQAQVRRLPVVDEDGALVGLLSLSDLAQHLKFVSSSRNGALGPRNLSTVLEAVSRPREATHASPETNVGLSAVS